MQEQKTSTHASMAQRIERQIQVAEILDSMLTGVLLDFLLSCEVFNANVAIIVNFVCL